MVKGFKSEKFKQLVEVKSGYTWDGSQETDMSFENCVPVLTVTNVQETLEIDKLIYLKNVSEVDKEKKKATKNWTIAVNSNGNKNRVGQGIFIEEDTEYLFASFLIAFKPKNDLEFDPKYFFYWYSSPLIQKRISAVAEGTTGLSNLELRYLKNTEIEFPIKIEEQEKIVSILSAVDDNIKATKQSIAKLERLKKSLMQNLLTGKLKVDGTLRGNNEFFMDEKFGRVPKGWSVKNIGDKEVAVINPNYDYKIKQQFDFLEMADVDEKYKGVIKYENVFIDKRNSGFVRFKNGDTIFAKITPCTENGKIAFIENLTTAIGFGSTEFIAISPTEKVDPYFIYLNCISHSIHSRAVALMEGTTGRQRVPVKIFKNVLQIAIPLKEEQEKISERIRSVEESLVSKINKLPKLERIKKSLMQNLLAGKIRVSINEKILTQTE